MTVVTVSRMAEPSAVALVSQARCPWCPQPNISVTGLSLTLRWCGQVSSTLRCHIWEVTHSCHRNQPDTGDTSDTGQTDFFLI